jgi:hypothetical protein
MTPALLPKSGLTAFPRTVATAWIYRRLISAEERVQTGYQRLNLLQ